MSKKVCGIAAMLMMAFASFGQEFCGTDHHYQQMVAEDPSIAVERAQLEAIIEQVSQGSSSAMREGEKYVIPTVVHVLWYNCEGNISKAQVEDAIDVLNRGMKLQLEDTSSVREVFQDNMGALDIEFRLARIDPDGNPTDGINRVQTGSTLNANNSVKTERWPHDEYFNIWVVENINIGTGGQVNGYAQFPSNNSWSTWGVVIRNDRFGTIGTSTADGSTLTHEVGHCFNLYHTFQDGCGSTCSNSGDRVCDTPPAANPDWSCSATTNTCSNDAGSGSPYGFGTPDMMENFMSYSSCRYVFTKGQVDRMEQWALNYYSVIEGLWAEDNLLATGVAGFQQADFQTDQQIVVAHTPVSFQDRTLYDSDAWQWDFGASTFPPASTDQHPEATFIETGLLPVAFTAYFEGDSLEVEKPVFVVDPSGRGVPFFEDFESIQTVSNDYWLVSDVNQDDITWELTDDVAYSGSQSLMIPSFGLCGATSDELISTSLDLEPFSSATLTFKAAFAKREEANNDNLRIWISEDFGETWNLFWVRGGNSLRSVTTDQVSDWAPADTSEWRAFEVDINQGFMKEGILLKIEFVGDGGNNIYLDDIALEGNYRNVVFLRSPANGTLGLGEDVMLDWTAVGDVDFYEYQMDFVSSFDSPDLITGTKSYLGTDPDAEDTEHLAEALEHDRKYYWRVRYNKAGSYSDWSEIWNFRISNSGVGVREADHTATVHIFPNPATEAVTITASVGLERVVVYDLSGRTVKQLRNPQTQRTSMGVSNLASGTYIVRVTTDDGNVATHRLMVR